MGLFFHSHELRKGASPAQAREKRTYVRLQIDQDYFAWRGKKSDYVDNIETFPWNTAPPDPWLVDEPGYQAGVNGFFLSSSRWYWVEGSITLVSGRMRYHARLKTAPAGAVIAEAGAERADIAEAYGSFGFFSYTQNSAGHKDRWADWTVDAPSLFGAGSPGGHRPIRPRGQLQ